MIIASGSGFADALAGSLIADNLQAPILMYSSGNQKAIQAYIKENMLPGGTIYILGGPNAVSTSVEKGLEEYTIQRLWGNTRYETNLAILNRFYLSDMDILICSGKSFADSLSVSSLGLPILLVDNQLTEAQKAFLQEYSYNRKYIIGGTSAISSAVEAEVLQLSQGSVQRIGGKDRFETSLMVAEHFFPDSPTMVLSYAYNFPDGLCGGPVAYTLDAPMVLTANGKEAGAIAYVKEHHSSWGYVLGGTSLISDTTAKNIFVPTPDNSGDDYSKYYYLPSTDELWQPMLQAFGSLDLRHTELELLIGDYFQLEASYPEEGEISWGTSNPSVALVGPNGLVLAQSVGTAVIRLTDGKTACYCKITVIEEHTPQQKEQIARNIAQWIADEVLADPACTTDLAKIAKAAKIVNNYVANGHSSTVHPDYNTAYGTFVAGYSSCAGDTRALGMVLECLGFKWSHVNENQWDHQWCIVYDVDGKTAFADGSMYGIAGYGKREDGNWYQYHSQLGVVPFE